MKKRIALLMALALVIVSIGAGALASGEYLGTMTVVNCDSWVTLRSRPSTHADTVSRVPKGASVEVYACNSEFYECYYLGMHGYILTAYLSGGGGGGMDYLGTRYIVNCDEFVTLRARPSTSSAAITRVARGQKVEAYYYNGTFCYCRYKNMEGYILSKYLGRSSGGGGRSRGDYLGTKKVGNCDSWVTLRARPSTHSDTVSRVPKGAKVEAYYYNGEFAECYYLGLHGYILTTYLK